MKFTRINLCIAAISVLVLGYALPAHAVARAVVQAFTEVGKDVNATWRIQDKAANASSALPLTLTVFLCEDDIFFNDRLGVTTVVVPVLGVPPANSVALGISGGYRSPVFTFTFLNASNAATGFGDDYFLTLDGADCNNRRRQGGEYDGSSSDN